MLSKWKDLNRVRGNEGSGPLTERVSKTDYDKLEECGLHSSGSALRQAPGSS